jgi:hypothetical protein
MTRWRTHNCLPADQSLVGRRVQHAIERDRLGTIQSVDDDSGMMRVWWDGQRCPGYGPTEATAPENVEVVSVQ